MKIILAILAALSVALPTYSQQTVFEYPDGLTVKFNPNGTRSGINIGSHTSDPSALNNGDAWYNSTSGLFKIRAGGQTLTLGQADLSNLNAANLTSGTVPDARFPATLPALSGVNLTALNAANLGSGTLPTARFPAFTGDVTTIAGAVATTLATVNANVGSFGGSTAIPTFTVNGKGLVTAAGTAAVVAPAGTLSGATLAANVTASSLTSVAGGTIGTAAFVGTSTGGNGTPDDGKAAVFSGSGNLTAMTVYGSDKLSAPSLEITGGGFYGAFSHGGGLTANRDWLLPDADGTLATQEWATAAFQTIDADLSTWAGITPGANVGTFLATPTSANLAAALTNETGSTLAVFSDSPTFSTTVNFPAGSASVPGLAFASDADGTGTGIYRSAANETSFAANGIQKVKIEADGDVKILNTTASVNGVTGALVVSGGIAAAGNSTIAANLNVQTATYSPYFGASSGGVVKFLGSSAGADATRLAFQFTPSTAGASIGISGTTITAQRGDGTAGGTFAASGDLTVGGAATVTGVVTAGGYASSSGILNAQTGTTYTLLTGDNGRVIKCTNAGAITVTVPAGLPVGFSCQVIQGGAGTVTFAASGTTVNSFGSLLTTAGQYAAASIISDATNTFILTGNLQ